MKRYAFAAALLACATAGNAAVVYNFTPGGSSPAAGHTVFADFNDGVVPAGSMNTIIQNFTNGDGALPAFGDGSKYLSVRDDGFSTITFGTGYSALSFQWGSVDNYNSLVVFVNGVAQPAYSRAGGGGQTTASPGDNGLFTIIGDAGEVFTGITFLSGQNSFEVDNLAGISAVPELSTWGMMIAGFGIAGGALRRRQRQHAKLTLA